MTLGLDAVTVAPGATVRETMLVIDQGGIEIALVVDTGGRLIGMVSDGDVRRALLGGASLGEPVAPFISRSFAWVPVGTDRAAVLDLMQARYISQVPILDETGHVVGLHLLHDLLGLQERPNVAVVMAGGRGSRLRPFTDTLPKPMIPVAGRPILERIVLHLVGAGIRRIFLAVNYKREVVESHFGDGARFGCTICYLREDPSMPLGTGGALALLPADVRQAPDAVLLMNGDLVTQFDVGRLLEAHVRGGYAATVGVRDYVHDVPFGVVRVDGDLVRAIDEKPTVAWPVNAGVYVLSPTLIDRVPTDAEFPVTDLLADCIGDGLPVGAHNLDGDWADVGRPHELLRARGEVQ